jgi:quinol monooxygenase YgiN
MTDELNFDVKVSISEIEKETGIPFAKNNSSNVYVSFNGYGNLLNDGRSSFCTHKYDGYGYVYAVNVKYYNTRTSIIDHEIESSYDLCQNIFFLMVEELAKTFGFESFSISGRSGGYVVPFNKDNQYLKSSYSDQVDFEHHLVQIKMQAFASEVKEILNNVKRIFEYSKSYEQVQNLLEKIYKKEE